MARFQIHSSSSMAVFFSGIVAALVMLMLPAVSALPALPPLPPLPPITDKFLLECVIKIADCGMEIFNAVFYNATVSPNCCARLIFMGRPCHFGLVEHLISQPFFQGNKTKILDGCQCAWNNCAQVVHPPSPFPSPSPSY